MDQPTAEQALKKLEPWEDRRRRRGGGSWVAWSAYSVPAGASHSDSKASPVSSTRTS
jgi:hypothetical protein